MLSLAVKKELKFRHIHNLEIRLETTGYRKNIESDDEFNLIQKDFNKIQKYLGHFIITESGPIKGHDLRLHTYRGTIDHPTSDHIHTGIDIIDLFNFYKLGVNSERPTIYTLAGLYSTLFRHPFDNKNIDTKISALKSHIRNHIEYPKYFNKTFEFDTIATNKKTILKILENKYKNLVSNQ